ncbi:MAG: UbiA family prenyltransferase [Candidatus Aenigmarchaeota archaeon]|nr:UbiA family prenyltransferase [Candidatus Aenigmarchaeota archaeon]
MMLEHARLIRPGRCLLAAAAAWIGALLAGVSLSVPLAFGVTSIFLIAAGGFALNDFFDAESDKLNKPNRPVAKGKVGKRSALAISAAAFAFGIAFAYLINFDTLIVAVIATGLLVAYSNVLKKTMLIGNLIVSGLAALAFIFGGLINGNYQPVLPLALMIFLTNTGREIYKSIDNSLIDKRYDENSIAMKMGVINARIVGNIFLIAAVIFSFVPYLLGLLETTYLFFAVISDIIFLLSAVLPAKYGSKLVAVGIMIAVFSFLSGSIA